MYYAAIIIFASAIFTFHLHRRKYKKKQNMSAQHELETATTFYSIYRRIAEISIHKIHHSKKQQKKKVFVHPSHGDG